MHEISFRFCHWGLLRKRDSRSLLFAARRLKVRSKILTLTKYGFPSTVRNSLVMFRDPEARQTPSGQLVAVLALQPTVWRDKTWWSPTSADFHNIVAWGNWLKLLNNTSNVDARFTLKDACKLVIGQEKTGKTQVAWKFSWKPDSFGPQAIQLKKEQAHQVMNEHKIARAVRQESAPTVVKRWL